MMMVWRVDMEMTEEDIRVMKQDTLLAVLAEVGREDLDLMEDKEDLNSNSLEVVALMGSRILT